MPAIGVGAPAPVAAPPSPTPNLHVGGGASESTRALSAAEVAMAQASLAQPSGHGVPAEGENDFDPPTENLAQFPHAAVLAKACAQSLWPRFHST